MGAGSSAALGALGGDDWAVANMTRGFVAAVVSLKLLNAHYPTLVEVCAGNFCVYYHHPAHPSFPCIAYLPPSLLLHSTVMLTTEQRTQLHRKKSYYNSLVYLVTAEIKPNVHQYTKEYKRKNTRPYSSCFESTRREHGIACVLSVDPKVTQAETKLKIMCVLCS